MIRIAFLHRERCHKRADTDSVFSHTIFHCACSFLSLSVIWWLLINISYGIINLLHKGNFNIYILCIIVHGFFVSVSLKKNYSWISCKLNDLPWYERVNVLLNRLLRGKVITDPDICPFFVDNWENRGRVDKAKDFRWRWGIEQETRTGDYSRNPSNRDGQLKHRQLESVRGRGDSRG